MRGNHGEVKKGQLGMEEQSQSELATEDQLPTSNYWQGNRAGKSNLKQVTIP